MKKEYLYILLVSIFIAYGFFYVSSLKNETMSLNNSSTEFEDKLKELENEIKDLNTQLNDLERRLNNIEFDQTLNKFNRR